MKCFINFFTPLSEIAISFVSHERSLPFRLCASSYAFLLRFVLSDTGPALLFLPRISGLVRPSCSQSGSQNGAQSALLFWPKRLSVPGPSALPCSCTCQDGLDEVALYVTDGDGELVELELVSKGKLDSLLLHLGKPVLVLGDLRQGGLDEVALHAGDG